MSLSKYWIIVSPKAEIMFLKYDSRGKRVSVSVTFEKYIAVFMKSKFVFLKLQLNYDRENPSLLNVDAGNAETYECFNFFFFFIIYFLT